MSKGEILTKQCTECGSVYQMRWSFVHARAKYCPACKKKIGLQRVKEFHARQAAKGITRNVRKQNYQKISTTRRLFDTRETLDTGLLHQLISWGCDIPPDRWMPLETHQEAYWLREAK